MARAPSWSMIEYGCESDPSLGRCHSATCCPVSSSPFASTGTAARAIVGANARAQVSTAGHTSWVPGFSGGCDTFLAQFSWSVAATIHWRVHTNAEH